MDRFRRWWSRFATLMQQEVRTLLVAPNQGEVERLASLLREYELPYRLGSRDPARGQRERCTTSRSYLAGDLRTPVIVRTALASGVSLPDARLVVFGAQDFFDEADVTARPVPKKSKTAAFVSDFRDLTVGDYVVHVEHGIARYQGLREIEQDGDLAGVHDSGVCGERAAVCAADAAGPDPEIPVDGSRDRRRC